MRIALVSREYPPFFGGGIGAYTVRWSGALAAAGHTVVVITVSDDGTQRREQSAGVTVIRLPFIRGQDWSRPHPAIATARTRAAFSTFSPVSVFAMQVAEALPGLAAEFLLDAVEFPETGALGWFTLNGRRTGRLWPDGGPSIVTVIHSPSEWIAHWNRSPLRERRDLELAAMEEDCVRWSDGLVCPSRAVAEWAERRWGLERGRVRVVPLPLGDLEPTARATSESSGQRLSGIRRLVYAGRLEPRKGVDTLLNGFASAVAAGADLHLDLIGEDMLDPDGAAGFGSSRLERLTPEARARVKCHGKQTPARVAELQAAADAVVVPAPMDNFPFTCVEAMSRGRIVIAARAGGMCEMIRDGRDGVLFEPGDSAACAAALRLAGAMDPAVAVEMGRSAAARILALCGNERIVRERVEHVSGNGRAALGHGPGETRDWVVVDRNAASEDAVAQLRNAAEKSGAAFAHGWTRDQSGRVRAFSTPRVGLLALAPRQIGPLVVERRWAERPELEGLLRFTGENDAAAGSSRVVAIALLSAGATGVVAPEVLTDEAGPGESGHDRAAELEAELARIHASRGWGVLQRVYDLLHILRGRGLRRR